jgi:outer membrane protein assembly factor BamB
VWPSGGGVQATAAGAEILSQYLAFVPNTNGFLYVYNVQTGLKVGERQIDTGHTPAFDEETDALYVGGNDGILYALNAGRTLDERWRLPSEGDEGFGGPITTAITLAGGKLFFGVADQLWQVDLETQSSKRCEVSTGGDYLTPVVSDGLVYAANPIDQVIYTFDAETCTTTKENILVQETLLAMPAVADNVVYQPHQRGVSAFIFGTRKDVEWLIPPEEPTEDSISEDDRPKWWHLPIQTNVGSVASPPVIAGDLLYITSRDNHVYALDRTEKDLAVVWQWDTGAQIVGSVAVTDRVVYVATTGGEVVAIAPVVEERLSD